jgi:hypothetical protein
MGVDVAKNVVGVITNAEGDATGCEGTLLGGGIGAALDLKTSDNPSQCFRVSILAQTVFIGS